MIFCIDGTGPMIESDYNADMRRGFCYNIAMQNGGYETYWRGPSDLGVETFGIVNDVVDKIRGMKKNHPSEPVLLAGHSRGGAICLSVAKELKKYNIKVTAMVLFDAVRRCILSGSIAETVFLTGKVLVQTMLDQTESLIADKFGVEAEIDTIDNVDVTLHMVRSRSYSNYFRYCDEWRLLESQNAVFAEYLQVTPRPKDIRFSQLNKFHWRMLDACRFNCIKAGISTGFSFGNTGKAAAPGCGIILEVYDATHGAMGGAPLEVSSYIEDRKYQDIITKNEIIAMKLIEARANTFLAPYCKPVKLNYSLEHLDLRKGTALEQCVI